MEIGDSARKHGIEDADIVHAVRVTFGRLPSSDDDVTVFIGISRSGDLLELGILDAGTDTPIVIHAMKLRKSYYRFL